MAFRLRIEDGAYVQTLEVRTGALTVGRNPPQGLALSSPGLSARHAVFRQKGDRVEMEAMATKIGVRLRGERVDHALLAPNETILVGWAKLTVVEITPETDAAPATDEAPPASAPPAEPVTAPLSLEPAAAAPAGQPMKLELADAPAWRPPSAAAARPAAPSAAVAVAARPAAPAVHRHAEPAAEFVVISRKAVRVLPWWGISIAVHAMLVAYALMLPRPETARRDDSDATFSVTLRAAPPAIELDRVPVVEPTRGAVDVQRPDMAEAVDTQDSTLPPSERPKGDGGRGVPRADESPLVLDEPGGSPWAQTSGSTSIGVGTPGRLGTGVGTNLDESFGKGDAGRANSAAAGQLNGDPFTRSLVNGLRLRTNADNVKVVRGDYDSGELVMRELGLGHGIVTADELARSMPSERVRAIFYNCTGRPAPPQMAEHVELWVKEGGWLFSSDWGIENLVEKSFPGYLRSMKDGPRTVMTPDTTITFTIAPGRHPLLAGLPPEAETARWWLEESSIPFVIEKPAEVEVLVQSAELERKYRSKLVAVTFPYGEGRVVHVLGHMYQKEGNLRGAYAMQRLLLNFLYQAIKRR